MSSLFAGDLRMLPGDYAALASEMLAGSPLETVASGTAGWWREDAATVHLLWRSFRVAVNGDYIRRGPGGAVVTPAFLAPTVKRCRESGEAMLLVHTHPFSDVPSFSGIDDGGEDVLIPKVRDRAPTAPHGGVVLGRRGASVRVWFPGRNAPRDIALSVAGNHEVGSASPEAYARQDLALGPGTAAALGRKHVAIIGTGGLGWDIATLLWSHGIGRVTLIDPDEVEVHNRPRLRGSRPEDVGRPKVEALADALRAHRTDGDLVTIGQRFEAGEARRAAAGADLIVSATDTLASRLDTDRYARRLLIPLIDAGINIQVRGRQPERIGGRVNVSYPDGPCLTCMGVLTPDAVAAEAEPLGYRASGRLEEAAVAGYNAVLSGLAVTQALALLIGLGAPYRSRYFNYDGLAGIVREVAVPPPGTCGSCVDMSGAVAGALP